jgi:hypothetical protein
MQYPVFTLNHSMQKSTLQIMNCHESTTALHIGWLKFSIRSLQSSFDFALIANSKSNRQFPVKSTISGGARKHWGKISPTHFTHSFLRESEESATHVGNNRRCVVRSPYKSDREHRKLCHTRGIMLNNSHNP